MWLFGCCSQLYHNKNEGCKVSLALSNISEQLLILECRKQHVKDLFPLEQPLVQSTPNSCRAEPGEAFISSLTIAPKQGTSTPRKAEPVPHQYRAR